MLSSFCHKKQRLSNCSQSGKPKIYHKFIFKKHVNIPWANTSITEKILKWWEITDVVNLLGVDTGHATGVQWWPPHEKQHPFLWASVLWWTGYLVQCDDDSCNDSGNLGVAVMNSKQDSNEFHQRISFLNIYGALFPNTHVIILYLLFITQGNINLLGMLENAAYKQTTLLNSSWASAQTR